MTSVEYFELSYLQVIFPGIWLYVTTGALNKEKITLEDLKNINGDLDVFGVQTLQDCSLLSKKNRELVNRIKTLYDRNKKSYEEVYYQQSGYNYPYQQTNYYDQQQQTYYANNYSSYGYPQQGGYPQQTVYAQQGGYPQQGGYSQQGGYPQNYAYPQGNYQTQNYGQQGQGSYSYNQQSQAYGGQSYGQQYGGQPYGGQHYGQQQQAYQNQQYNQYSQPQVNGTQEAVSQGYGTEQSYETQATNQHEYRNNNYRNNHHNHHHYQNNQSHKYVAKGSHAPQEPVTTPKVQVVEPAPVKVEVVEEKKPEPPKPIKKKMSIEEIKQMIASANDKEGMKKLVDPTLVKQIEQVNNWKQTIEKIDIIAPQHEKGNKNYPKKEYNNRKQDGEKGGEFVKGSKYNPKAPVPQAPAVHIIVGKNENVDTALLRKELTKKADNFADKKAKEQESLEKVEKCKREIQFNLNRVAPENLKEIFNEIQGFATEEEDVCMALVESIIEKSWEQPKYAASYAKLSSYFAKIDPKAFKFGEIKGKDKKTNPFKHILVEKVQHSFDKKQKKETTNLKQEDIEKFARETKNLLIGNVKFIAELIKIKLIPKGIIKYCIGVLVKDFVDGYYNYHKKDQKELNFYEYNFEALIEFLENLGEKYESIDGEKPEKTEKGKKGEEQEKQEEPVSQSTKTSNVNEVQERIRQICSFKQSPPENAIDGLENLKADEYFLIFKVIEKEALPKVKDGSRISALLQNLEERRIGGWKKHNVEAQGPKKLKDLNKEETQATPEQKQKADLALLDEKMAKLLKKWVENDHKVVLAELEVLCKKYSNEDLIGAYLKFVADDKKDSIPKRMEIFDTILEKYIKNLNFKKVWNLHFVNIAMLVSEFPFCAAVLAKFIISFKEKYGGANLAEYFIKFDEDEQMDEYYFMDEVFQKLYHYSQDEGVKSKITPTPSAKLKHLL